MKTAKKKEGEYDSAFSAIKDTLDDIQAEQREHRSVMVKLVEKTELMSGDMRDIKRSVSGLVKTQASTDRTLVEHDGRLTKVEGHLELA